MALNAKPLILYDNRYLDGTPTATDTDTGFDVLNIRDLRTYTFWQAAAAGTKYLTVDCGEAQSADALAIVGHTLGTAEASIWVQYSPDNWVHAYEAMSEYQPPNDKAFLQPFTSVSARYWRVKITTASVKAKLAVCLLGERLTFEQYCSGAFDPDAQAPVAAANVSDTGNLLGVDISYHQRTVSAQFQRTTASWATGTFLPAWEAHLSLLKPFMWAWDIENHATEVYFVRIAPGSALAMPYNGSRRTLTLSLQGVRE
jgi:hypothetical protein